ncbi:PREDICTED: uncharacterized protein LOC106791909 [Polistes canadensis]|uniref:uncharacterized protein LOC106791909 n=1 Tax=Polistes canadensis TaxID=91411 RepID=UPI000718FE5E|nr:PREDICTED: uncharacterized protein LOC106791909 [Polistes canadensis]
MPRSSSARGDVERVDAEILEEIIKKTFGEAKETLFDEIPNHVESVINANAETVLINNRTESVASQVTNSPTASLLSQVSNTVSSPSEASIYRIPTVQLPRFDGQNVEWPRFTDTVQAVIGKNPVLRDIQKFAYLKSCLSKPTVEKIKFPEIIAGCYPTA